MAWEVDATDWFRYPDEPFYRGDMPDGPPVSDGVQLAVGHFVPEIYPMRVVAPRPDSETGDFSAAISRYRWAYYDGVNPIRYEAPIKMFGGSAPHRYSIITAPDGATVGNLWNPESHGVVKWTPTRDYPTTDPAQFVIRVTGQDGNFIDVSWTVATSIDQFIFLANSGSDTNTGLIGSPLATLNEVMGDNTTDVTYPGKIVYLRGGSYNTVAHLNGWNGGNATETIPSRLQPISANQPYSYIGYPGEAVGIDFSGAEINFDDPDFCIMGSSTAPLTISGSSTNAAETHNLWGFDNAVRFSLAFVTFDGFIPRVAGNFTNSAPIFSNGSNQNPTRQYWAFHDVNEINRTVTSANDGLLYILFGLRYHCDEYCSSSRASGRGPHFKDTCYQTSTRYAQHDNGGGVGDFGFSFMGQVNSNEEEICFSFIRGSIFLNLQADADTQKLVEYRNTVYTTDSNFPQGIRAWAGVGPFESINTAVIANGPELVRDPPVTATGTECQVVASSSDLPFDTDTGLLVNVAGGTQWRDTYLGTRGWEII